jgi:hypothetical protein
MKTILFVIMGVDFDVSDHVLIIYPAFVNYFTKRGIQYVSNQIETSKSLWLNYEGGFV